MNKLVKPRVNTSLFSAFEISVCLHFLDSYKQAYRIEIKLKVVQMPFDETILSLLTIQYVLLRQIVAKLTHAVGLLFDYLVE